MQTLHTKGVYICTGLDQYMFDSKIIEKDEIQWYGRVQLEDRKLKFIITIGDYIICQWNPGDTEPTFENRNDPEHGYSKINKEWVMCCMGYDLVNSLLPRTEIPL